MFIYSFAYLINRKTANGPNDILMMYYIKRSWFFFLIFIIVMVSQLNYLPYMNERMITLKDENFEFNDSKVLSECPILTLKHDNEVSMKYFYQSLSEMNETYLKCDRKDYKSQVNIINISQMESHSEIYRVRISAEENINCQIIEILRISNISESRESAKDGDKKAFQKGKEGKYEEVEITNGYYRIECSNTTSKDVIYEDVIATFPTNASQIVLNAKEQRKLAYDYLQDKIRQAETPTPENPMLSDPTYSSCEQLDKRKHDGFKKMNVLIIALDSVSLAHLKRTFPKTYSYISQNLSDNLVFENMNIVGENTFANILPFFSGVAKEESLELNLTDETQFYKKLENGDTFQDLFPLIWKKYEEIGYLTMYQEETDNGAFNYLKDGFRFQPTSIYPRVYWYIYNQWKKVYDDLFCHNNIQSHKRYMEITKKTVELMNDPINKNLPYFFFNFYNHHTHDYMTVPENYDFDLREMIKEFEDRGFLDNTMLIMMADHGARVSSFSDTDNGVLERTNPFITLRLPKALRETEYFNNAKHNTRNIVSHFDFYKTLQHFYYINKYPEELIAKDQSRKSKKCRENFAKSSSSIRYKRGISVLEKLSNNRTCSDALVPVGYCNCKQFIDIKNEKDYIEQTGHSFNKTAEFFLKKINEVTDSIREKCEVFKFDGVNSVKKIIRTNNDGLAFRFDIICQPGGATFDIMFKYSKQNSAGFELIRKIIRSNRYGSQSDCVPDNKYGGFCFCK